MDEQQSFTERWSAFKQGLAEWWGRLKVDVVNHPGLYGLIGAYGCMLVIMLIFGH